MNVTFRPETIKGLAIRVDVFNLFNKQTTQVIDEVHENASDSSTITQTYGRTISYTNPRSVRFTMNYNF